MVRPLVYINMAMTVDGKITSASREYPRFTSPLDRSTMDRLRAAADAVIIGAGTLRADDPPLHIRDPEAQTQRDALGLPAPWHIVVSRSLDIAASAGFFTNPTPRRIVATVNAPPPAALHALQGKAEIWHLGDDSVDLHALLARLADAGIKRLLLEGGADLNWQFCAADLIDEVYVTLAPALLGGAQAPTPIAGLGLTMAAQRRLTLLEAKQIGDELYCHYAVKRSS